MRLSTKSGRYERLRLERHGVEPSRADVNFDRAMGDFTRVEQKLMFAAAECVLDAARRFARAADMFESPELGQAVRKIREAIQESRVPPVAVGLRMFITSVDRDVDLASDTPEAALVNAATSLEDAARDWGRADYSTCHANTVRCRSSLNSLVE